MFKWYRNAELCLVYLADIKIVDRKDALQRSEWFRRGWTLQELLAPPTVVFVSKTWRVIGNKGASFHGYDRTAIGPGLEKDIAITTGIPELVLHDYSTSLGFSAEIKLNWMEGRITTREEDMSYALYGIFGVAPGANYGEETTRAKQRLLSAIRGKDALLTQHTDSFRKIQD